MNNLLSNYGRPPAMDWPCSPSQKNWLGRNSRLKNRICEIGDYRYRAEFEAGKRKSSRRMGGAEKTNTAWNMRSEEKNVYFFLAPMEKGRLQVLPVAFDAMRGPGSTQRRYGFLMRPIGKTKS